MFLLQLDSQYDDRRQLPLCPYVSPTWAPSPDSPTFCCSFSKWRSIQWRTIHNGHLIDLILISWNPLKLALALTAGFKLTDWSFYAQTSKISNMNKRLKTGTKHARGNIACCPLLKRKTSKKKKKSCFTNYEEIVWLFQEISWQSSLLK